MLNSSFANPQQYLKTIKKWARCEKLAIDIQVQTAVFRANSDFVNELKLEDKQNQFKKAGCPCDRPAISGKLGNHV